MNNNDQTMAANSTEPLVMTQCPYWGQGGQYLRDPVTGKRTRIEASTATDGAPAPTTLAAEASVEVVGDTINNQQKKEKTRG